jgi:hypothetical protein
MQAELDDDTDWVRLVREVRALMPAMAFAFPIFWRLCFHNQRGAGVIGRTITTGKSTLGIHFRVVGKNKNPAQPGPNTTMVAKPGSSG